MNTTHLHDRIQASEPTPTGEAIQTLRIIAGLTLDQAAVIADTAPAYLSKVENGMLTPTVGYVANVTAAFAAYIKSRADHTPAQELADKVAASILRSGLSKTAVATKAGIPSTTFGRKINGHTEFTFSELVRIATVVDVAPSELIPLGHQMTGWQVSDPTIVDG